jgi:hypothetical protein
LVYKHTRHILQDNGISVYNYVVGAYFSFRKKCKYLKAKAKFAFAAIARVALDQRLGCLKPDLDPESDAQKMIDAVGTFFKNVGNLELKIPFWRLFPTPTFNKYINALDTIRM